MPSYGMWEGISQGMTNFAQMYMMKQKMDLNKQDREIRLAQMFFNSQQGYAKLVDSGANPDTLRNFRQMHVDLFNKLGISVPKNYLNITDPKRLTEASSQAFIGKTGDAIAAWREDLKNPQKEADARKFVGMMQSQTKFKLDVKPWLTQLASLQQKKGALAKQEAGRDLTGDMKTYYDFYGQKPSFPEELKTFREKMRLPPQPSLSERETMRQRGAVGKLQTLATEDPNKVYAYGYKMNEDRSLYLDPVTNAPIKLPDFHKVMGKRGQIRAMKQLGENWDDSKQLMALLKNPEVAKNLQAVEKEVGFWDRVSGKWNNKVRLWMQKRGIAANSPTGTAITRMQRLASQERKEFLGVAVTGTELETTLAWMPNAGDSLSTMLNKTQLMVVEGEETFRRYLDIYKDVANMTPFYRAFGLERFPSESQPRQRLQIPQPQRQIKKPVNEADAYLKSIGY